jgi:DNA modification methylase
VAGDPATAQLLKEALEAASSPDDARLHIHGFHSYPARLHPQVAAGLIPRLSPPGGTVLDPFCGSGTVLIEARLAGRKAIGVDLNPLAARLARFKTLGRNENERQMLVARAVAVAEVANERRARRSGASRRYAPGDVSTFAPHVLLELDGLRVGIEATDDIEMRHDLELILSSLLTKLSLRAGDSAEHTVEKRIAAGYPSRLFIGRARELSEQLADFAALLPDGAPVPVVVEGDARDLRFLADRTVDLVLSSPPYPGNYDYWHHHAQRIRWLGLDDRALAQGEVGARRTLEREEPEQAAGLWRRDLGRVLLEARRVLVSGGKLVFILADSVVRGRPFYNDEFMVEVARGAGFAVLARASQQRPHFHGPTDRAFARKLRCEHAICLSVKLACDHAPGAHRRRDLRARCGERGTLGRTARGYLRRHPGPGPFLLPRRQLRHLPHRDPRGR